MTPASKGKWIAVWGVMGAGTLLATLLAGPIALPVMIIFCLPMILAHALGLSGERAKLIVAVNVLFGWLIIPWFVALVLVAVSDSAREAQHRVKELPGGTLG